MTKANDSKKESVSGQLRTSKAGERKVFVFMVVVICFVVAAVSAEAYQDYKFHKLSTAEHLRIAQTLCPENNGQSTCPGEQRIDAIRHLEAITDGFPEYGVAGPMLRKLKTQLTIEATAKAQKNFSGFASDPFTCAHSAENEPILSFDRGVTWWKDFRGQCAAQKQRIRDRDAEIFSYVPTTIRVKTDIDSSWLPSEERVCVTYPDEQGRVATVLCNGSIGQINRSIPIKFWGGVKRNSPSDWKCSRESDSFACKAID